MAEIDRERKPQLFRAVNHTEPESYRVAGGTAAVLMAKCPDKETDNEDSAAIIPIDDSTVVLAVADGMGGGAAGERASALAVGAIVDALRDQAGNDLVLRSAILDGFEHANEAILQLGVGAGTTLAVVEICDDAIRPYHVGDSVILLVGGRGKLKLQTISHSPVGYAVEAGVIDEAEAIHHEDRHIVSNVLGMENMRIEIGPKIPLARRDTLLLASDGLSDNLRLDEIVERAKKGQATDIAGDLYHMAQQRMAEPGADAPSKLDDLSIIVFRND